MSATIGLFIQYEINALLVVQAARNKTIVNLDQHNILQMIEMKRGMSSVDGHVTLFKKKIVKNMLQCSPSCIKLLSTNTK